MSALFDFDLIILSTVKLVMSQKLCKTLTLLWHIE